MKSYFSRKRLVMCGLTFMLSFSVLTFSAFDDTEREIRYHIRANDTTLKTLPAEFKREEHLRVDLDKLGYNPSQANANIMLNLISKPIPNDKIHRRATGNGVLHVGKETFSFGIVDWSRVRQVTLRDGQMFVFGPIDAVIKNRKGEEDEMSLSLSYLPKTQQAYITCTIGTLDEGIGALSFGSNFITPEMLQFELED